jgi:hypothetical protein
MIAIGLLVLTIAGCGLAGSSVAQPSAAELATATGATLGAAPDPTTVATAPATPKPTTSPVQEVGAGIPRPLLMPARISARTPMPFCGHDSVVRTRLGDVSDPEPWECLIGARESGTAAELIRDSLTTEGGPIRSIFRTRPSGEIEWWGDATQDPLGGGQWTRTVCGRLDTVQSGADETPVHHPEDCGQHEVVAAAGDERQPTGDEMAMLEALVLFARTGDERYLARVPLSPDGVWLGLGDRLIVRRSQEELERPRAWRLDAEVFRGFVGPFSVLTQLASWGPGSDRQHVRESSVTVGPHPHCASPSVPAPAEVEEMRRLSIQPVGELACLAWWTVDLFVEPGGDVAAITLDRYEP